MKSNIDIKMLAQSTFSLEADNVRALSDRLDEDFIKVIEHILVLPGRVVLTGIGKSAIIAQKIVATLNSTGTPAIFMHAADAIHGDLGMIQKDDLIVAISKSGNTPEIKVLVPYLKQTGNLLVAMVGNRDSFLAQQADFILDTTITREACPNNLAPTTSTTVQLAMGDAIAVCLQSVRQFSDQDFAKYHPGGALGKKLYLKVGDLSDQNGCPEVSSEATVREILISITKFRLGATVVIDHGRIQGIITDGDIRRMLEHHQDLTGLTASDIMSTGAKTIDISDLAANALHTMRQHSISQLIVCKDGQYAGIVHLQDILKEGII